MSLPPPSASVPWFDALLTQPPVDHRVAPAVRQARAAALGRATTRGLPSRRDERWRYSDLRALARRHFVAISSEPGSIPTAAIAPGVAGFPFAFELVTLDGLPQPPPALPAGVAVEHIDPHRNTAAGALALDAPATDAFGDLNSAFAVGGLRLRIAADAALEAPILINHQLSATPSRASHPRLVIELAPGARAVVIERFASSAPADGLCNASTRLVLGAGSRLEHLHWQDQADAVTHLALLDARLDAGAELVQRALHFGALLGRFAARIELAGREAAVEVFALNAVDGRRRGDLQLEVRHAASATRSRQSYRGLASGRGKAAATTRAVVLRDAAGCDATQSLGSLLLSPHAEADARPELEIENDDVRCSHGATIGQLDDANLFYLRSRGLSEAEARAALVFAFADAVLTSLPRGALREKLESRLRMRIGDQALADHTGPETSA